MSDAMLTTAWRVSLTLKGLSTGWVHMLPEYREQTLRECEELLQDTSIPEPVKRQLATFRDMRKENQNG